MRPFNFAESEYYHLYNRGTEKRTIFLDSRDYERFLALLYLANSSQPVDAKQGASLDEILGAGRGEPIVALGAYCLMPNHFHLLAKEITPGGISKFMQKLMTGYTMYFNRRNERTGGLFQGKFKAEHAANDRYLKYLFAYIHLNPVKLINGRWREDGVGAKEKRYIRTFAYSSYQEYAGIERPQKEIITPGEFPEYFSDAASFEKEMHEWLDFARVE